MIRCTSSGATWVVARVWAAVAAWHDSGILLSRTQTKNQLYNDSLGLVKCRIQQAQYRHVLCLENITTCTSVSFVWITDLQYMSDTKKLSHNIHVYRKPISKISTEVFKVAPELNMRIKQLECTILISKHS